MDSDAFDDEQPSVAVAKPVPRPVDGQRVGQPDVRLVEEHAALRAVHVRPLDLRRVAIPVRPEDFSESNQITF